MAARDFDFGLTIATDRTKSLDNDGFTLGSNTNVNQDTITYHYVAFNQSPKLHVGTYTGDGVDGRDLPVPPLAFNPAVVHIRADAGQLAVWKPLSLPGDASLGYGAGTNIANRIQSLTPAPGQFEVGTAAEVNSFIQLKYYFFALD